MRGRDRRVEKTKDERKRLGQGENKDGEFRLLATSKMILPWNFFSLKTNVLSYEPMHAGNHKVISFSLITI